MTYLPKPIEVWKNGNLEKEILKNGTCKKWNIGKMEFEKMEI